MLKQKQVSGARKKGRDAGGRKIHQARDSLIRIGFSNPKRAGDFARAFGPKKIKGNLAKGPAEILPTKFISEFLRPSECDGRFRMDTEPDDLSPVEFVLEAKSSHAKKVLAQLLGYAVSAVFEWLGGSRLPAAVCCILLYTGARPWRHPLSLERLLSGLAILGEHVLDFHIHIVDFSRLKPEDLYCINKEVTAILLALYFSCARRRAGVDIMHWMETIFMLAGKNSGLRKPLVAFFLSEYDEVSKEMVDLALRRVDPKDGGKIMASAAEELRAEGRAEGRDEGRAEGRAEVLSNVLQRRFGPLPEQYSERIAEAGPQEIEDWFMQSFDSSSIDQVFNGHGKG